MSAASPPPPQVSVALCTYNGARYLREQLDSLLAQRDVALEVVALDDGSSDDTCAILAQYAQADPRLRWQANPRNLGPTASFEAAMALCRGDLIAPADQDDIWEADKLARLVAALGDADLIYCDSAYVDADGRSLGRRVSQGTRMLEGTAPLQFLFANSVSGHASVLRRDLFAAVRPFPELAYHDWWLALCAAGRNGVRYLDAPLVRFRRHGTAFSPMGKAGRARRDPASATAWLDHRHSLMRGYARLGWRDADTAAALAAAMDAARAHGRKTALMRLLWQLRRDLPRWKGVPALDALKMQWRVAKNLRRAGRKTGFSPSGR
ncbi:MAG: glycosyltransferase family 2 protein [Proteobacteria bacterium]|nr:glycosyltransferase family 2 protein [Pseudomonadota bacterium]